MPETSKAPKSQLSALLRQKPEGTKDFPMYHVNSLSAGKVFAEASMGFMGDVEYHSRGDHIIVKTTTTEPVAATLGCQLAGWTVGSSMMSGPVRMLAKKPSFIFDKVAFPEMNLPRIACIEGDARPEDAVKELFAGEIDSADLLFTDENSQAQFINIPARAIEIALFRLFFLTDINNFRISRAMSTVEAPTGAQDMSSELNDAIRFNGRVTLMGDFGGFRDFETLVTMNTPFDKQKFGDLVKKAGSVAKCPLEVFSVGHLTIIDNGKTRVY